MLIHFFLLWKGSKSNGSSVLTCGSDGKWSGTPSCIPVAKCSKCLNGGICVEDNVCACPSGYVGEYCQIGMIIFMKVCELQIHYQNLFKLQKIDTVFQT